MIVSDDSFDSLSLGVFEIIRFFKELLHCCDVMTRNMFKNARGQQGMQESS